MRTSTSLFIKLSFCAEQNLSYKIFFHRFFNRLKIWIHPSKQISMRNIDPQGIISRFRKLETYVKMLHRLFSCFSARSLCSRLLRANTEKKCKDLRVGPTGLSSLRHRSVWL